MRELYELTTLAFPLLSASEVAKAARDWVSMPDAVGALILLSHDFRRFARR
jgi:hypothetical protein